MKFILDAHLPLSLKKWLINHGHDVIHTFNLPQQNYTDDIEIIRVATKEQRIVASKDTDFHKHHILKGTPEKLLMITTGNIVNKELILLFEHNFSKIEEAFDSGSSVVELSNTSIVIHE